MVGLKSEAVRSVEACFGGIGDAESGFFGILQINR